LAGEKDKNNSPGFKITDKRFSSKISEEVRETEKAAKEKVSEDEQMEEKKKSLKERIFSRWKADSHNQNDMLPEDSNKEAHFPEIDFSSFIISLGTQAMMHLGEIPDPLSRKKEKNLSLAKQTIDLLAMIQEKTKGNLTIQEEQLIENLLYELRIKYVKESK